jgi:hypothetical protein
MWLSNRDMNQAIEKAVEAPPFGFDVVFLMSRNEGMRWDIEHTRDVIGYVPEDYAVPQMTEAKLEEDRLARAVRLEPGLWYDENFKVVAP